MKKDSKPLILTFFKENFASRTFEVPLNWVHQLGAVLLISSLVTFLAFGLALRYYFESRHASPARIPELEAKVQELEAKLQNSKVTSNYSPVFASPSLVPSASATPTQSAAASEPTVVVAKPTTPAVTPVASTAPAVIVAASTKSLLDLTKGLVDKTVPQAADIRVELEKPKLRMSAGHLFVDSAIRYVADDGEIQRGYILILAHTTKGLVSYPFRALTGKGEAVGIEAGLGEFFAVGRYREVHGEFGAIHSIAEVKKIEILLISNEKKPLVNESLTP